MSLFELLVSSLGFGAAAAKSSYDLNKRARSYENAVALAEHKWEFDRIPQRGGHCHLLEFDVAHYKIRQDLITLQPYIDRCMAETEWPKKPVWPYHITKAYIEKKIAEAEALEAAGKYEDARLAREKAESVRENHRIDRKEPYKGFYDQYNLEVDNLRWKAIVEGRNQWMQDQHPGYAAACYTYKEYVQEYVMRTVVENGYVPSNIRMDSTRSHVWAEEWNGKRGLWFLEQHGYINFATGIPDQEKRKEVAEMDRKYRYG